MTTVLVVGLVRPHSFYVVRRYHTGGRTQSDHRLGVVRIDRVHRQDVPQDTRGQPGPLASHRVVALRACDQGTRQLAGKSHVIVGEYKYSRLALNLDRFTIFSLLHSRSYSLKSKQAYGIQTKCRIGPSKSLRRNTGTL